MRQLHRYLLGVLLMMQVNTLTIPPTTRRSARLVKNVCSPIYGVVAVSMRYHPIWITPFRLHSSTKLILVPTCHCVDIDTSPVGFQTPADDHDVALLLQDAVKNVYRLRKMSRLEDIRRCRAPCARRSLTEVVQVLILFSMMIFLTFPCV